MSAFLISFSLIFFAELGDKSQLVALWFATRYRWWLVILAVTAATLVVHLGSTAIGASASDLLPEAALMIAVGLSFYLFALWGLRGDTLDDSRAPKGATWMGAFGVVATAFFVSELGDKTQLATMSIAGNYEGFVGVWLGSTLGMVAADALAIALGVAARNRVPDRTAAVVAAVLFGAFGTAALVRAGFVLLG